jgi:hypothetical protein
MTEHIKLMEEQHWGGDPLLLPLDQHGGLTALARQHALESTHFRPLRLDYNLFFRAVAYRLLEVCVSRKQPHLLAAHFKDVQAFLTQHHNPDWLASLAQQFSALEATLQQTRTP